MPSYDKKKKKFIKKTIEMNEKLVECFHQYNINTKNYCGQNHFPHCMRVYTKEKRIEKTQ